MNMKRTTKTKPVEPLPPVVFDSKLALEMFEKRKARNAKIEKVDNASLYAGSPMTYYCRHCGELTAELPEGYLGKPRTICEPCEVLRAHGLI